VAEKRAQNPKARKNKVHGFTIPGDSKANLDFFIFLISF
jgi:hypothetical protein